MTELVAAVPAAPELGFTHFIAQTDVVGQGLFVILVIMSLVSWALIVTKGVGLFRRQRRSQAFLNFFWNATSLEAVQNEIATHGVKEPFAHLTAHAMHAQAHHARYGAAKLEEVGAHVVYGVVGHKCHAKMLLIVRKEKINKSGKTSLVRYAHLGTGNYHPRTAKLYTDFGLMTCDPHLTKDIHHVFQQLTGTGMQLETREIWEAPFTMLEQLVHHIRVETRAAKQGKKARIIGKMNALLEPTIIEELYKASQAGVQIDLIVRGVCALRPGVKGLSENIKVRSIVGRFLEHHRIYYFYAGSDEVLYLSSADWMERNLLRRVEVAFPVKDAKLKQRVIQEGLMILLKDNASAWLMKSDGTYIKNKVVLKDFKNIKDVLNKFQYGVYVSFGFNTWNPYIYYGLNPIFDKDKTAVENNVTALNIGLKFYIL